MPNPV